MALTDTFKRELGSKKEQGLYTRKRPKNVKSSPPIPLSLLSGQRGKLTKKLRKRLYGGGITLTKKDMYDKYDNCILPKGSFKRFIPRSKYSPHKEDEKRQKKS